MVILNYIGFKITVLRRHTIKLPIELESPLTVNNGNSHRTRPLTRDNMNTMNSIEK